MAIEGSVTETKYWDQEQRRRQINRVLIGAVLIFTFINTVLNWVSIVDRRKIHEVEQVTADRLNARAEIHIMLVVAYADQRPLTLEEKARILELWTQARYPERLRADLERAMTRSAVVR